MQLIDIILRASRIPAFNPMFSLYTRYQSSKGRQRLDRAQAEPAEKALFQAILFGRDDAATWGAVSDLLAKKKAPSPSWLRTARYYGAYIGARINAGDEHAAETMILNVMSKVDPNAAVSDVSSNFHRSVLGAMLWYFKPGMRDYYAERFLKILQPKLNIGSGARNLTANDGVRDLSEKGYYKIGKLLSKEQVADVVAYFSSHKCKPVHYYTYSELKELSVDEIERRGHHYASYRRDVILRAPHLLEICNSKKLVDIAEAFLGCPPTLSSINVFWTFGSRDVPGGVSVYHRDINDFRCVGMYIYLTDVDADSGPHAYVKHSSDPEFCRSSLERRGMSGSDFSLFFKPPWGGDLVKSVFSESIEIVMGEAGTAFMHDTYGLHAGITPKQGRRLIFYVVYSTMPLEMPVRVPDVDLAAVPTYLADSKGRYINRVYFQPKTAN